MVDNADTGGMAGRGAQSIRDLIERTFLIGVGAAAFTKDRIQELVEEFVRRGELSTEEGRDMVDRLMARSRDQARSAAQRADSSFQGVLRDLGLPARRDIEDLEMRMRQVEHRVTLLENVPSGPEPDSCIGDAAVHG